MDTLSHGLWGSLAFGRKNKKSFWLAFFFGAAPDLFSFGPFFAAAAFGLAQRPPISGTPPLESSIPDYVHILYRPTHSLIVFALAFLIIWALQETCMGNVRMGAPRTLRHTAPHRTLFSHAVSMADFLIHCQRMELGEPVDIFPECNPARAKLCRALLVPTQTIWLT